jgi:hypothetical protein
MYLTHISDHQIDNLDPDSQNSNLRENGSLLKNWKNGDKQEK